MRLEQKSRVFIFTLVVLVLVSIVLVSGGFLIIRFTILGNYTASLKRLAQRIDSDLQYRDGTWDTTLYNADPLTPYPSGSSGFTQPLYIVTTEGFVIERNALIHGYLDTSDFKHLMQFTKPQTIRFITNESWRVMSAALSENGVTYGVIFCAFHNPLLIENKQIDTLLEDSIQTLQKKVSIEKGRINKAQLDLRDIDNRVSFEIVDRYNRVVINNGRTPSFLDVSYVQSAYTSRQFIQLRDAKTEKQYLVLLHPLVRNGTKVGIVVSGIPLGDLEGILFNYTIFVSILGIVVLVPLMALNIVFIRKEVLRQKLQEQQTRTDVRHISFDKKGSSIVINNEQIKVPYASNQYYLCQAIFALPKKRWETDELLEKMGIPIERANERTVYDTMLLVNKRVNLKLITHKDKTYQMNFDLIQLLA